MSDEWLRFGEIQRIQARIQRMEICPDFTLFGELDSGFGESP